MRAWLLCLLFVGGCLSHQITAKNARTSAQSSPEISPNAPKDQPISFYESSIEEFELMVAPCRQRALATYPEAKARYLAGLPRGYTFFVTVPLRDTRGYTERVFLVVDGIAKTTITGRVWNQITLVEGYKFGQAYSTTEAEILDWTITQPDGSEEGNWSGKFIDALHANGDPSIICAPLN